MAWFRRAGAYLPPAAFLVGMVLSLVRPREEVVYTQSLLLVAVAVVVAGFGGQLGGQFLLGYVISDLVRGSDLEYYLDRGLLYGFLRVRVPQILSYIWLGTLTVTAPFLAVGLRRITLRSLPERVAANVWVRGALQGFLYGALVYAWSQAIPLLIRPIFVWTRGVPPVSAAYYMQAYEHLLVTLGVASGMVRAYLEHRVAQVSRIGDSSTAVLWPVPPWAKWPPVVQIVAGGALSVFLLAGMILSWWEALLFLVLFSGFQWVRSALQLPGPWRSVIERVPLVLRLGAALWLGGYLSKWALSDSWYRTNTFQPVMIGVVVSLVVFYLLVPDLSATRGREEPPA